MFRILEQINSFVWGVPALVLIAGVGIYLTVTTRCLQLRMLPGALHAFLGPLIGKKDVQNRSRKRALYTALAATVGTGNLAGVAGAITLGGPGAIFWMWIFGFLGMLTKFAEATLAVRHRIIGEDGKPAGGPMYMVLHVFKTNWHFLAYIYCFFGVVASFGVGNGTQVNAVIGGIRSALSVFNMEPGMFLNIVVGGVLAFLVLHILSRGVDGIGGTAERLVPFAALLYILLCVTALLIRIRFIPAAFRLIIEGAFCPKAATGGIIGSFIISLRVGAARGVFTNEAGMGTASMAHATASVDHPVEQGLMGIVEVFVDTILICTLTALVILTSGVDIPYGLDIGIALTTKAFVNVFGQWVSVIISVALCLFAFATILGWSLYGLQCAKFMFGEGCIKKYVYMQTIVVILGALMQTGTVWLIAEIVNGLMAIPNLIILARLSPELRYLVKDYAKRHLPKQVPRY